MFHGRSSSVDPDIPKYCCYLHYANIETTNKPSGQVGTNLEGLLIGRLWQQAKMHTISWDQIFKPLEEGGLGFQRHSDMNLVALAKLAWRFLTEDD